GASRAIASRLRGRVPPNDGRWTTSGVRSKRVRAMSTSGSIAATDSVRDGMTEKTRRAGTASLTARPESSTTATVDVGVSTGRPQAATRTASATLRRRKLGCIGPFPHGGTGRARTGQGRHRTSIPSLEGSCRHEGPRLLTRGNAARLPGAELQWRFERVTPGNYPGLLQWRGRAGI